MYGKNRQIDEDSHINCDQLNSISSFKNKISFKKHSHKINHIDLQKNLLMTSGDDDLIIIMDLKMVKYVLLYYDIINGTKFSKFLEPLSTRIIYYGYKSFKLYVLDFVREEILFVISLLKEQLTHFEFNNKSNLLLTTQEQNTIIWKLEEKKLNPEYNIKSCYYVIINDSKQQIISCSRYDDINKNNGNNMITIYKYENNTNLEITKENIFVIQFEHEIKLMNFFKNYEYNYLILMSEYSIEIIDLDDKCIKKKRINLFQKENLIKFSYFEPVFTKEIIIGYNNGDVEIFNPWKNQKEIDTYIQNKYNDDLLNKKLIEDIANDEVKHHSSVVQIKMSDFYPLYVSIADEMIIYQIINN